MLTDKYPCVTPLLWGECFRRNLEIIYECTETETDQPGRWPAEESFLEAGLFTTDTAESASPRCFHFYHPHLTGLKTTMQPFFFFFFISGSQWKDKLVSWVFFHVWAQWAALPFSGVAGVLKQERKPAEFSAFKNTVWNLVGRTSSSILLTLQSPTATKLIWYKTMKSNEILKSTWCE